MEILDISDVTVADGSDAKNYAMFGECSALKEVTLGSSFQFRSSRMYLPTPPTTGGYIGKWVERLDDGSTDGTPYAPDELAYAYYGHEAEMAGTYVWATAPSSFSITFDLDGGNPSDPWPTEYVAGEELILPGVIGSGYTAPTKDGYDFDGWVDEAGEPIESIPETSTGDRTIRALWAVNIRFQVPAVIRCVAKADGTLIAPSNVAIVNETPAPIRTSHIQASVSDGWRLVADAAADARENAADFAIGPSGHEAALRDYAGKTAVPDAESASWEMSSAPDGDGGDVLPLSIQGHIGNVSRDVTSWVPLVNIHWFLELSEAAEE